MSISCVRRLRVRNYLGDQLAGLIACALLLAAPALAEQRAIKLKIAPTYPEIARRLHVTGIVKLEVTVDADGKVTAVKTVSGNHVLADAAEEAVHKWKFAPASNETTMDLDVDFDLNK